MKDNKQRRQQNGNILVILGGVGTTLSLTLLDSGTTQVMLAVGGLLLVFAGIFWLQAGKSNSTATESAEET